MLYAIILSKKFNFYVVSVYLLFKVLAGQLSVLKDEAGKPALLNRFGSSVFDHANLTAAGFLTWSLETIIVSPSMRAFASTNF